MPAEPVTNADLERRAEPTDGEAEHLLTIFLDQKDRDAVIALIQDEVSYRVDGDAIYVTGLSGVALARTILRAFTYGRMYGFDEASQIALSTIEKRT